MGIEESGNWGSVFQAINNYSFELNLKIDPTWFASGKMSGDMFYGYIGR
jgi:hypothetical protein